MMNSIINRQNILDKNIYLGKSFLESIHLQCYNMYNKIRAKNTIIKITMVAFTNENENVNVNDRMLSLFFNKKLVKIIVSC